MTTKRATKKRTAADWSAVLQTPAAGGTEAPLEREVTLSVRVPESVRRGLAQLALERTARGPYRTTIAMLTVEACQALLKKAGKS